MELILGKTEKELRSEISDLVKDYYNVKFKNEEYIPGETPVRYAGRVY
jgi:hypothetical protein